MEGFFLELAQQTLSAAIPEAHELSKESLLLHGRFPSLASDYQERLFNDGKGVLPSMLSKCTRADHYVVLVEDRIDTLKIGIPVRLATLRLEPTLSKPRATSSLSVFAFDEAGALIGDREAEIKSYRIEQPLQSWSIARGMIATGLSGAGLATVIEAAYMRALQQEANQRNERVDWKISNLNAEKLNALRERAASDPALAEEVATNEREQARWQALYGVGGRCGFGETWRRSFYPQESKSFVRLKDPSEVISVLSANLVLLTANKSPKP